MNIYCRLCKSKLNSKSQEVFVCPSCKDYSACHNYYYYMNENQIKNERLWLYKIDNNYYDIDYNYINKKLTIYIYLNNESFASNDIYLELNNVSSDEFIISNLEKQIKNLKAFI